jgi:hypothetical protein
MASPIGRSVIDFKGFPWFPPACASARRGSFSRGMGVGRRCAGDLFGDLGWPGWPRLGDFEAGCFLGPSCLRRRINRDAYSSKVRFLGDFGSGWRPWFVKSPEGT